jgi:hypothetical protein
LTLENPFDHNVECRFCDEQAGHRADCGWLLSLVQGWDELQAENARLERKVVDQEQVLTTQLRTLDELRGELDAAHKQLARAVAWPSFPFDLRGHCLYCDQHATHTPDCRRPERL